jgi:hypothetical protein
VQQAMPADLTISSVRGEMNFGKTTQSLSLPRLFLFRSGRHLEMTSRFQIVFSIAFRFGLKTSQVLHFIRHFSGLTGFLMMNFKSVDPSFDSKAPFCK